MRKTAATMSLMLLFATGGVALERTHDESFDFSAVKSFAWIEEPGWKVNPVADRRVRSAVESELTDKGYQMIGADGADLLLDYRAAVRDRLQIDEVWRGRRLRGPVVRVWDVATYAEGTLLLDMLSADDRELVWRGTISGAISRETAEKRIKKAVARLLKKFPPGE